MKTFLSDIFNNAPEGTPIWNTDKIYAIVMGNSVTVPEGTVFTRWEFDLKKLQIRVKGKIPMGKNKFVAWSRWTSMDSFICDAFEVAKKLIQSNE